MKITKKNLPKSQLELTIEIPFDEMNSYIIKSAEKISKDVKISGFRPGKAPYEIIKQQVGENAIMEQASNEAINKTLVETFTKEKLEVIGQPKVEIIQSNCKPLIYKATITLLPKITLNDYKSIKAEKKEITISEEDINKTLQELQQKYAKEIITNRPIQKGDKILINLNMSSNKVPLEGGQLKNHSILVGKESIIKGFNEKILGMKREEKKEFELEFPKEHFDKNLAGKIIEFSVKINEIYERTIPEINNELAKSIGNYKDLEDLKKEIKKIITEDRERKEKERLEGEILEKLINQAEFEELPDVLLESEKNKMLEELKINVTSQGGDFDNYLNHIKKTIDDLKNEFTDQAIKRIKTSIAIREISIIEKIQIEDSDIDEEINKILKIYQGNSEIEKNVKSEGYRNYLKNILINRKVIATLLNSVAA
ncbi:trigger factor [Patescibacteria group bacterium]